MATVLEMLECAKINLVDNAGRIPIAIGAMQLGLAIAMLGKGYSADDDCDGVDITNLDTIPQKPETSP